MKISQNMASRPLIAKLIDKIFSFIVRNVTSKITINVEKSKEVLMETDSKGLCFCSQIYHNFITFPSKVMDILWILNEIPEKIINIWGLHYKGGLNL